MLPAPVPVCSAVMLWARGQPATRRNPGLLCGLALLAISRYRYRYLSMYRYLYIDVYVALSVFT